jgi:hypothetical protein
VSVTAKRSSAGGSLDEATEQSVPTTNNLCKAPAKEPMPLDEEAMESENDDDGSPKLATLIDNGSLPDKEDSGGKKTVVVSTESRTTVQEDVDDTTMAAKVTAAVGSEKDDVKPKAATRKKQ